MLFRWSSTLSPQRAQGDSEFLSSLAFFLFLCPPPDDFRERERERAAPAMLLSQRRSALFALLLLLLTAVAAPRLSQAAGWGQNSKAEGVPPATPEPISDASSSATSYPTV